MTETIRESNPHDLKKYDEAPQNYISGENLLSLLNKHSVKFDDTNYYMKTAGDEQKLKDAIAAYDPLNPN